MSIAQIFLMTSPGGNSGSAWTTFIPFLLIIVVFYFFMIRPQAKKAKQQQNFKTTLDKGNKIVTIGGVHGRIAEIKDSTFLIEVGNGIKMEIEKSAVSMELTQALQKAKAEK